MEGSKLYVGNLSYSVDDSQLEELFAPHGSVQSASVISNKGFGFVELGNNSEAEKAREALDGSEFEGRTLRVDEARPRKERSERSFNRSF
jgi:RNA recognition motif-containing protein